MRSALVAALAVGGAVAGPLHGHFHFHKRDTVVQTDVETVTAVTTVVVSQSSVQAQAATTTTAAAQTMPTITWSGPHSHSYGPGSWSWSSATTITFSDNPAPSTAASTSVPTTVVPTTVAASTQPSSSVPVASSANAAAFPAHPTGTAENTCTSGADYDNIMLWHHNIHRQNHSLPLLAINTTLVTSAQSWATQCNFSHETSGENLYAVSDAPKGNYAVTDAWYYGELDAFGNQWGRSNIAFGESYGHLTQVLDPNGESVGCATVDCGTSMHDSAGNKMDERYITVCHYYPAGNIEGSSGLLTEVFPGPVGLDAVTSED